MIYSNEEKIEEITFEIERNRLAKNLKRIEMERLELEGAKLKQKLEQARKFKLTKKCDVNGRRIRCGDEVIFAMMGKFDPGQSEKNLRRGVIQRENRVYIEIVHKSEEGKIRLLKRAPKNVMVIE